MARVTKINVGGTNYDIAHEGELKNSGFEVVTELPTTGLFAGREVMYNGKKYVYSSGWKEEITANTMYEDKLLYNIGTIVPDGSVIDRLMIESSRANVYAFTNPNAISVQYSQDAGVTWADYELSELDKQNLCTFSKSIYCGGPGVTAGNVNYRLRVNLFPKLNQVWIFHKLNLSFIYGSAYNNWLTVRCLRKNQEDIDTNYVTIIDKGAISGSLGLVFVNLGNIDMLNEYDKVVLDIGYDGVRTGKGLSLLSLSMYATYSNPTNTLAKYGNMFYYDINKKSYFAGAVESKELINFDVNNIEPTQTGSSVSKTSTWLWQYLVQGVNWLKANDNTKLDKRAYNQIYTNCGYVNFDNNSVTGALIIELPFAPNSDENNSMTYIELNVYSHRKGCSKYIIGVYSFSQNSQYEWSVYSYMGYNYFSKISFGRRTDNNNIVVVLGDFTDVHQYEHFSISHIITGFYRNNDDTDGFLLYTDSDSNNYGILKQSTDNPLIISYEDLTNKPTLATVATSGSYNDLTDKPTFSGSYNDLTDKPTLFSGSYEDLTNKPTLATVATSGSYNDLTDKPTFSGSYNDLTDKPTLFSGSYEDLTNKPTLATVATSGSYNDLTNTPNLATVATSGSYNDLTNTPTQLPNPNALNIMVLDSEGASLGPSIVYDGVDARYLKLTEGYGIRLSNSNLSNSNSHEVTINLKQIAGTTLLGNANGTTDIPQAITMAQLRTMLGSLTLNGISVTLGGNSSYTLPCFISYSGTLYQARIENNWLQIYRNGVWANLYYLLSSLPTECRYITDLSDPSWFDESVSEYELDNSATTQLLSANSSTNLANWLEAIDAQQITFNSSVIPKRFNKGALDNIISNLKGKGYSVFVENDIDTILQSGNDWVISIKIKRFNDTYKAIIECYVAK